MKKLKSLIMGLASLALAVSCYHLEKPGHGEPREVKDTALQLVKVSEDTITVVKEYTYQLQAYFYPEGAVGQTVTWKSLDETVAGVDDNGLVSALEFGQTHIVITSENGITDSCVVHVLPNVHVERVVVEPSEAEIFLGGSLKLTASVYPEDARVQDITWTSDHPEVAAVDEKGKVTAVTEGTATITATSEDGGKTGTCLVTVKRHAVTGVSLNISEIKLDPDGQVQLRAIVEPFNATYPDVTWSTSDASVVTVSETGLVKAVALGTATVTATTVDGGFQATCAVTVADPSVVERLTLTFDLSTCPASMAGVASSIGTGEYDLTADDGNAYAFRVYKGNTATASYSASGYLVLNLAVYLGSPAILGRKLVSYTFTQAASTKTNRKSALTSDVHDGALQTSWFDASVEANGESIVTGTKGEDYTYTVVNPVPGARYYLVCANSGIGISKIVLTYE